MGQMKKILGLDSLRFLAFLMIFSHHTLPWAKHAYLGVDFFFVLSSFLLTLLALKEIENSGSFSKINFFIRRSLRIFPLYFLIVIFSFFALPYLAQLYNIDVQLPEQPLLYFLFLSNYENSDSLFALKFLWSIAVEEQFYLIFIVFSFLFKKHLWVFVAFLLTCYVIFMLYASQYSISTYSHTLSHFVNFAFGIIGAYIYYKQFTFIKHALKLLIISVLALGLITNTLLFHLLISIAFISLILEFIQFAKHLENNRIFKITEHLGQYTYGLYLYSGFIITLVLMLFPNENLYLRMILELILLIPVAMISYHLYEKKFLKLKSGFRK